ncbi:MAG TPA: SDR family NAD(P)-dependent oxidoreductase [Propionibacteriaceae bacterium]|nr:SDR family NAD(P)-dependent oxidoreductase [Propionibacteriaceae bacterium]
MTEKPVGPEYRPAFLVTGATSGVGEAIATQLGARGAQILIGARTTERGEAAADRIRNRVADADLQVVAADLSLMREVRSLAYQVMDSTPRLDGLILNAAEARSGLVLTDEGIETNFATNHLAGFLLAHLLLPRLRSAAPARVVAISSAVHTQVRMVDLSSVVTGAPLTPDSYRTSKLLNILFIRELARRIGGLGITANVADPGFVRTNLGRYETGGRRMLHTVTRPMQSNPERAATTAVYLATSDEVAGVTGGYYANRHPLEVSGLATDAKLARRLWSVSAQALVSRRLATLNEMIAFGGS